MSGLSASDLAALGFFVVSWGLYHLALARGWSGQSGLNRRMEHYRRQWMRELSRRENRIVDGSIMASLQNGTAFFASTSLIAIGGVATLLRSTDDVLKVFSEISVGLNPDRALFELKVVGLLAILGYAFFKFAWAYRLYNYTAILFGATPPAQSPDAAERERISGVAGRMNVVAGSHFTRGQRAFFFAMAWLGWFLGPWTFLVTTSAIVAVMWARQYSSDALAALGAETPASGNPGDTSP